MPVLKTSNLTKEYTFGEHTIRALDHLDFEVNKGEFVAIMGPSGSGKSTLLHLMGGLDSPSQGEVMLGGENFSNLPDKQLTLARRHHIGFVFQFFNLLPTLTAEENILLPILIDGQQTESYSDMLERLLTLVGLIERRDHKPDQLSGGEQQRVAIARALITQPDILLADEPTGNLDSKTGNAIMELLRLSCNDLQQTIIVVTHDPRAAAFADRVIFLCDGTIEQELNFPKETPKSTKIQNIIQIMEINEE